MSFVINGQPFVPDYKAKERRLYQIIASRDAEITGLNGRIAEGCEMMGKLHTRLAELTDELRALKSKERRRAGKRKSARETE